MSRLYIANVDPDITISDLDNAFKVYGRLQGAIIDRKKLPFHATVEFEYKKDAKLAAEALNGKYGWRIDAFWSGASKRKCYDCGGLGHFARDCHLYNGSLGMKRGRNRSPICWISTSYGSPQSRRSPECRYSMNPAYRCVHHGSPHANRGSSRSLNKEKVDDIRDENTR